MDTAAPVPISTHSDDPLEFDLAEVDAAIELVRRGVATRVRLANLRGPGAVAATALARAQAAGVSFAFDSSGEPAALTFGTSG
jgi:hypothetical protein